MDYPYTQVRVSASGGGGATAFFNVSCPAAEYDSGVTVQDIVNLAVGAFLAADPGAHVFATQYEVVTTDVTPA